MITNIQLTEAIAWVFMIALAYILVLLALYPVLKVLAKRTREMEENSIPLAGSARQEAPALNARFIVEIERVPVKDRPLSDRLAMKRKGEIDPDINEMLNRIVGGAP